jgi:large subunit ribosomal protein L10
MPNVVSQLLCKEFEQELADAPAMVLLGFAGLTVEESSRIRNELAAQGVKLLMVRNKLARRVLASHGSEFPDAAFQGPTAIAYGGLEPAIGAAKLLSTPAVKKVGKITIKAGRLEGRVLDAADAARLASIPDRQTLRGQLLGCINGPARSLATIVAALPSGVARVLQAHVDSAGASTEAS